MELLEQGGIAPNISVAGRRRSRRARSAALAACPDRAARARAGRGVRDRLPDGWARSAPTERAASRVCSTSESSSGFATSSPSDFARARVTIAERAEVQAANRVPLERMLLEPGELPLRADRPSDLGEPGCGVWQVRPRLGLIGMLMGWWQVKLSSGCPLARGRG